MAEKVTDAAGGVTSQAGGTTGLPLGSITGALQGSINNLFSAGSEILDRWFPPEKREELKNKLMKFASERPKFAAFLLSQLALSGIPLALFVVMSLTVLVFALLAGVIVGVLGAVLFTVFCVGLALLVLLPTLFMTTFGATFLFLWGLGAYYIVKWFNKKEIPGVHKSVKDGVQGNLSLDSLPALNGDTAFKPPPREKQQTSEKTENNAQSHQIASEKQPNKQPTAKSPSTATKKSQAPNGKGTGADHGPFEDVKKTTGGLTSGVTSAVGA